MDHSPDHLFSPRMEILPNPKNGLPTFLPVINILSFNLSEADSLDSSRICKWTQPFKGQAKKKIGPLALFSNQDVETLHYTPSYRFSCTF